MAKTGFWLHGASGKLAGATMSKGANGETIMREVVTPKNPKTEGQSIQRIIMATVVIAYMYMKELCDHSFEGLAKGAKTMAQFMKLNLNVIRQKVSGDVASGYGLDSIWAFTPHGSKILAPNEFIISQGSLPQVAVTLPSGQSTVAQLTGLAGNSYQAVIDKYNLRRGDQLTFVTLQGSTPERSQFHFSRVILDPTNADGSPAQLTVPFVGNDNKVNLPSPRNTGEFMTLNFQGGAVSYGYSAQTLTAAGVIVSRKEGDTWLRSTCQLTTDAERTSYGYYSMQQCLDAAQAGGIGLLSGRYLNNAGEGMVANVNGDGLTVTLANGATAHVTGLTFDADNYVVMNDGQGNKYYLKGTCLRSSNFGKYIRLTENTETAPEGATDANTVATDPTFQNETGALLDSVAWLLNHGLPISQITA